MAPSRATRRGAHSVGRPRLVVQDNLRGARHVGSDSPDNGSVADGTESLLVVRRGGRPVPTILLHPAPHQGPARSTPLHPVAPPRSAGAPTGARQPADLHEHVVRRLLAGGSWSTAAAARSPDCHVGHAGEPAVTWANVVDGGAKWSTVAESGGWVEPGGGARMFVGSYTPKMDEKNRLFLPAKFRDQLAEGLVVTKGQDFCLNVFPLADFAAMTNRIQEAPLTVREAREYGRFLAMRATEDKPDKQGRITIPPLLKEYADLE